MSYPNFNKIWKAELTPHLDVILVNGFFKPVVKKTSDSFD